MTRYLYGFIINKPLENVRISAYEVIWTEKNQNDIHKTFASDSVREMFASIPLWKFCLLGICKNN